MIQGKRDQLLRALKPEAAKIIDAFLETVHLGMATGEQPLKEDEIFAKIMQYNTSADNKNMVEAHNRYVDIQFLLGGSEKIKVYDRKKLDTRTPYSSASDCEFFFPAEEAQLNTVLLKPGYFTVLFPDDAHLAALNPKDEVVSIHKIVIKIHEKYFA